jgi:hypothetical protein
MALDQRGNMRILRTRNQVAFPMAGNGAVFNLSGTFADRYCIHDLSSSLALSGRLLGAPHRAPRAQMAKQLPLQDPARLEEQTAVNRLMGYAHAPILGKLRLEPAGDLLR